MLVLSLRSKHNLSDDDVAKSQLIVNPGTDQETVLHILQISGDRVRVGVEAPENVRVLRKEVLDREHPGNVGLLKRPKDNPLPTSPLQSRVQAGH